VCVLQLMCFIIFCDIFLCLRHKNSFFSSLNRTCGCECYSSAYTVGVETGDVCCATSSNDSKRRKKNSAVGCCHAGGREECLFSWTCISQTFQDEQWREAHRRGPLEVAFGHPASVNINIGEELNLLGNILMQSLESQPTSQKNMSLTLVSCLVYSFTLKMETCVSETSVSPENITVHNHRCENFSSYKITPKLEKTGT
jgi:hypothetical protein